MGLRYDEYIKKPLQEYDYTMEEISEVQKCMDDIWHFLPYVKIVHPDRGRIVYEPYEYQKTLIKTALEHRFVVSLQSRQSGKTTTVAAYAIWYAIFNPDKTIGIVSNKQVSAIDILHRIGIMYEELPVWLKPGVRSYSKMFIEFDNGTRIMVSATSADAFRGRTVNLMICDEYAFVRKHIADDFWSANYPTISASEEAKIIIISTPCGVFNQFHTIYSMAERGENEFKSLKFDWTVVPGRDKAWAERQKQNLGMRRFRQEFAVEFLGSIATVIDPTVLEGLYTMTQQPVEEQLAGKFMVYEKPTEGGVYILGCVPEGQKVLTSDGPKNVEDVMTTDMLIDGEGNPTTIRNIQKYNDYTGLTYKITPFGSFNGISFTGEHPILVSKSTKIKRDKHHLIYGNKRYREHNFQFEKAEQIDVGDWVSIPNMYKNKTISSEDINKQWTKYSDILRRDFVMDNPLNDKEFWWFVGVWLGDGWQQNLKSNYSIHTSHNATTESHYVEKIKSLFERYNRKVGSSKVKNNTICTHFSSHHLHMFLTNNFGKGAEHKHIPEWVKFLPNEYKIELVRGYFDSDGCETNKSISMVSISLKLLEDIQDIMYSLDCLSNIGKLRNAGASSFGTRICQCKETYQLRVCQTDTIKLYDMWGLEQPKSMVRGRNQRYSKFNDDYNYIYKKIRKIDVIPYEGDVYNFETSSHTFLCRDFITHNCDTAKGTGENYSVIQVLKLVNMNPIKLEQVAKFRDNMIDVYKFAETINRISYYYNNAHIMVENNSEGAAIVSRLWWEYENEGLVCSGSKSTDLGIRATTSTKPRAVLLMKKLIEDGALKLVDYDTVAELSSFIEQNRKFFGKDTNDDTVTSLYWALYILEMDIFEEHFELAKPTEEEQIDIWGVLNDVEAGEDFSWLTKDDTFK